MFVLKFVPTTRILFTSFVRNTRYRCFSTATINHVTDSHSKESTLNKNHSSLYVSSKYGDQFFSILKPSFKSDYLTYVINNLDTIKDTMAKRGMDTNFNTEDLKCLLEQFIVTTKEVNSLKRKRNKILNKLKTKFKDDDKIQQQYLHAKDSFVNIREVMYSLEDKLIPFLLNIPNSIRDSTRESTEIINEYAGTPNDTDIKTFKTLNYVRLGYINNSYHSSIIGPNAQYFIGEGAKMYHALINFLRVSMEQNEFIPINGLDLVKSAIVEAVNSKDFNNNPYLLKQNHTDNEQNQRLHLVGDSSLESLCAFIIKNNVFQGKFYQVGSEYIHKSLEQTHCISNTILSSGEESNQQMDDLYSLLWDNLTQIGIKCRAVRCGIDSLHPNEYCRYDLQGWLHSAAEWKTVSQVIHYSDYISVRLGIEDYASSHIVHSTLDIVQLLKCIFEHYQDPTNGKINNPICLVNYFNE